DVPFEFPITTLGRLSTIEQFENIVVRSDGQGRQVRIKDVGHAELSARSLDSTNKVDSPPAARLAIFALPQANAIAASQRVRAKMEALRMASTDDLDYGVSLVLTPFIRQSIREVVRTLIEAIILVAAVVLLFLQNWRSALIPLVAVPVAIVGTFAAMAAI